MREFQSEDRFQIAGRGTVFTLTVTEDVPTIEIMGKEIKIDGIKYDCTGIERFGNMLGLPYVRKGERVGLLVHLKKEAK